MAAAAPGATRRTAEEPFDFAVSASHTPGQDLQAHLSDLAAAGVTWWRDGWIHGGDVEHEDWTKDVLTAPPAS